MEIMEMESNQKRSLISVNWRKFAVKTVVCAAAFVLCFILKQQTTISEIPAWNAVESVVSSGVDYRMAFETIGEAVRDGSSIPDAIGSFISAVFAKPQQKLEETVLPVVHAADLSIENLSFDMSFEEIHDDTSAEEFILPGSTDDTTITFPHTTPLYGVVTSPFGYREHPILQSRSFHTGIDIAGKSGSAIGSFADGTVVEVGYNNVYGNYILIAHADDYRSFYGHASKITAKEGETVSIGETVALVGTTGLSTGPHLHFEVRKGTTRLDPARFIIPTI